jgi:adenylyltransferase/sulfurtransferase
MSEAVCPHCREPGRPETVSAVEEDSPLAARPLAALGVPPYDVVRVDGDEQSGFFLLAADRPESGGWRVASEEQSGGWRVAGGE